MRVHPEHSAAPTIVLVISSLAWGLAWLPLKWLEAQGIGGLTLTQVAAGSAGLAILPAAIARREAVRGHAGTLLGIAVLGGYANLSFVLSLVYGDVVRVMVLFYLLPVWGAMGGRLFLGEPLHRLRLAAVGMAVLGAVLILGGPAILARPPGWIDAIAVSSGLAFAANNLVFRASSDLPLVSKSAAMLLGCATMAGLALAAGVQSWSTPGPAVTGYTLAYGLGWLLVTTLATQWGVTHLEAARASVIIILELVAAVVSATLLGVETWTAIKLAGTVLILAAAVMEAVSGVSEGGGVGKVGESG